MVARVPGTATHTHRNQAHWLGCYSCLVSLSLQVFSTASSLPRFAMPPVPTCACSVMELKISTMHLDLAEME
ncbi:hypothetical protein Y1Q_0008485 [Alligator mississippiensis]|uniref:Uncharacterized protein n=1 Tax=Alligator mississippiensis TaxID=8496 RepID=A0A151M1G2_ALLMI|nr:hypothetical protein Y1Q_0008485 [Alligator mississippiensis]